MRPELANNLNLLQHRLGDSLDSFSLDSFSTDTGEQFAQPMVRKALELKQIAGLHTGGSLPLELGSYRFGTSSGATTLGTGTPESPRFGVTLDAAGVVTVVPPPNGLVVDGVVVAEPAALSVGQVIDAGTARFELCSGTPTLNKRSELGLETIAPMPPHAKGRGVDETIVQWALGARSDAVRRSRRHVVGPAEISSRSKAGPPEILASRPDHPGFGRVVVGFSDEPFSLPGDLSTLNGATRKRFGALGSIATPIELDLLTRSVAIVGTRRATRSIAAWIALAIAADSAADAIGVMVMSRGNRNDWSWVDALPHNDINPNSPLELVVIDEPDLPSVMASSGTVVLIDRGKPVPDAVGIIIEVDDETVTFIDRSAGTTKAMAPIGVSPMFALEVGCQIAEHVHTGGAQQ